MLLLMDISGA